MGFNGGGLGSHVLCLMTPTLAAIVLGSHTKKELKTTGDILKTAAWHSPAYTGWELFVCLFNFIFWPYHMACGILIPWPGMEPSPPALEAQSLNQWITREVPGLGFLIKSLETPYDKCEWAKQ